MSKMDDLRAMREARYEQMSARASKPPAPPARTPPVAPAKTAARQVEPVADGTDGTAPGETLCGHRAISGRTCTREQGHAAKSHRYS
jgi:hypothetical protein